MEQELRIRSLEKANRWLWVALLAVLVSPWLREFAGREAVGVEPRIVQTDVVECRELRIVHSGSVLGVFRVFESENEAPTALLTLQQRDQVRAAFTLDRNGQPLIELARRDLKDGATTKIKPGSVQTPFVLTETVRNKW